MSGREPPVEVGREEARRAAADELSRSRYEDESLLERVWRWLDELLSGVLAQVTQGGIGGVVALVVLVVVLAVLAGVLLWSLRRVSGSARADTGGVLGGQARTAADHRTAARRLAEQERWPEAIQERMRAVARTLGQRELVAVTPGLTAGELASVAGGALPMLAGELTSAARLFDAVTYGTDPGSAAGYAALAALDEAVRTVEPVLSSR